MKDTVLKKVPNAVIKRLSLYSRVLQDLEIKKIGRVSSEELSEQLGIKSAQVRKDLAYFGQFGIPGVGYYVPELRSKIKNILGTDKEIRVALIGVGNLGSALLSYGGFDKQGFKILAAFDNDPDKIGTQKNAISIYDIKNLENTLKELDINLIIVTVPVSDAQQIANRVINSGIKAILNFVPTRLVVPPDVKVHYIDLSIELESLSFYLH